MPAPNRVRICSAPTPACGGVRWLPYAWGVLTSCDDGCWSQNRSPGEGRHDVRADEGHERREVPLTRFLVGELVVHVAGRSPDELLFTGERGAVMRSQTFQRAALTRTAEALKIPGFHPHELRHTAATLPIAARM